MKTQQGGKSRGLMRCWLLLGLISASPMSAQSLSLSESPYGVIQAYRSVDAKGERLTDAGWYGAARFFVKPEHPPQRRVAAVMEGEVIGYEARINGEHAQVSLRCSAVGQIDPLGRFTSLVAPSLLDLSGRPLRRPGTPQIHGPAPIVREYDLVLTDTHWEFGPSLESLREVKGSPEWRIETFEFEPWITIDVAIRYLTQLRDGPSSALIKRNAETSIAALRRLVERK